MGGSGVDLAGILGDAWAHPEGRGGSRKILGVGWPIISEATTAKRNYYKTNYIKHVEKLDLNYCEKNLGGPGQDLGRGCAPLAPT